MTRTKLAVLAASFAVGGTGTLLAPASAFAKAPRDPCNNGMCWISGGQIVCIYREDWICKFNGPDRCSSDGNCEQT